MHLQDAAELMQLLQSLLTPALLRQDPAALANPALGLLCHVLSLPLLEHVDGEGLAVELQHLFLENRGR